MGNALTICKVGRHDKEDEEHVDQPIPEHTGDASRPTVDSAPAATASPPAVPPPAAHNSGELDRSSPGGPGQLPRGVSEEQQGGPSQVPRGVSEEQRFGEQRQYDDGQVGPHGLTGQNQHDDGEEAEQQARMQMAAEIDRLHMEAEHLGQQIELMEAKKEAFMLPQEVHDSSEEVLWCRTEIAELESAIQSQVESNAQLSHGCAEAEQQIEAVLAEAEAGQRRHGQGAGEGVPEGKLQDLLEANEHLMILSQESQALSARNEDLLDLFKQEHAEHEELEAQIESLEADILPLLQSLPPAPEEALLVAQAERPDLDTLRAESARMLEENADLAAQRHELERLLEGIAPVTGAVFEEDLGPQAELESSQTLALGAVKTELERLRAENAELSKLRSVLMPQRLESCQTLTPTALTPQRLESDQAFTPSAQVTVHTSIGTIPIRSAPQAAEPERVPLCSTRVIQAPIQANHQSGRTPQPMVPSPQLSPSTFHWPQSPGTNPASQFGSSPLFVSAPAHRLGGMPAIAAAVPTARVR